MTTVFDDARVLIMVADYAGVDGSGKLNAIGAGFNLTQIDPNTGATPPHTLVVVIDVPNRHTGTEFIANIELRKDPENAVVQVPGPTGPQALRMTQKCPVQQPQVPAGVEVPEDLRSRSQFVMNFAGGLNLEPGASYRWRLDIDGQSRPQWNALFHVLKPQAGPVFGGPVEPVDPNMPEFGQDIDDVERT